MTIPYRTRRALRHLAGFILVLVLVAAAAGLISVVWLSRYVVYTKDGAKLDFSRSSTDITGEEAVPPASGEPVAIYYNEGSAAVSSTLELQQLNGYYIETDDLRGDLSLLRTKIMSLPDNTPIMIELKDIYGQFYYRTGIAGAPTASGVDIPGVMQLITDLSKNHRYIIASIPAFHDRAFGLENTIYGIPSSEGAYLYMDDDGCYWLDPVSNGTLNYLSKIISELKGMGFCEVVLTDFTIPNSPYATYNGDVDEAIAESAAYCMKAYSSDSFAVSFLSSYPDFPMPESGRGRLYLRDISPNQLKRVVEQTPVKDKQTGLVLLTTLTDPRFDDYGVLRSITLIY